jgi:hypothetical protein
MTDCYTPLKSYKQRERERICIRARAHKSCLHEIMTAGLRQMNKKRSEMLLMLHIKNYLDAK